MIKNTSTLKPILSHPSKTIALLQIQIKQQLSTLKQIKGVLPDALAHNVLHCVINGKKLILYTDSAVWASQLRFHNHAILAAAETTVLKSFSGLHVKVINLQTFAETETKRSAKIPPQAVVDVIRNHSDTLTDPQLKKALYKLSSTLNRLRNQQTT